MTFSFIFFQVFGHKLIKVTSHTHKHTRTDARARNTKGHRHGHTRGAWVRVCSVHLYHQLNMILESFSVYIVLAECKF